MATTYTEGGPGRKKCECGLFVAARTNVCPKCGHVFVSRSAVGGRRSTEKPDTADRRLPTADQEKDQEEGAKAVRGKDVLLVPSGRCPVVLEGTDRGAVQEWTYLLCDAIPTMMVSRFAARYFLRQFYPYGSEEYLEAASHIPHCRSLFVDSEFRRPAEGASS